MNKPKDISPAAARELLIAFHDEENVPPKRLSQDAHAAQIGIKASMFQRYYKRKNAPVGLSLKAVIAHLKANRRIPEESHVAVPS